MKVAITKSDLDFELIFIDVEYFHSWLMGKEMMDVPKFYLCRPLSPVAFLDYMLLSIIII